MESMASYMSPKQGSSVSANRSIDMMGSVNSNTYSTLLQKSSLKTMSFTFLALVVSACFHPPHWLLITIWHNASFTLTSRLRTIVCEANLVSATYYHVNSNCKLIIIINNTFQICKYLNNTKNILFNYVKYDTK